MANALNCESPKIQLTRTIRNALTVPNPTTAPPAEICNGNSFNIVLPNPATETYGGNTQYVFNGDVGVTVGSSTANSATYNTAVDICSRGIVRRSNDFSNQTIYHRLQIAGRQGPSRFGFTIQPLVVRQATFLMSAKEQASVRLHFQVT